MSEKSGGPDESTENDADVVDSAEAELTDSSAGIDPEDGVDPEDYVDPEDDTDLESGADPTADADPADSVDTDRTRGATPVTSGRATAGSARAAARRSGVRSGVTERKGTPTRSRETAHTEKRNVFSFLGRYIREVAAELRKVIWPARSQMVTYTLVVIVFVTFMVALVAGLDVLFAKGVLAIFG